MPRAVIEYTRNFAHQWAHIRDIDFDVFDIEDAFAKHVASFMCSYSDSRDFAVRVRDADTNYIYQFLPINIGTSSQRSHADNVAVEWHLPNQIPLSGDFRNMIKVGIRRIAGKLHLLVDAKEFHEQLDEIGCTHTGTKYNDRPLAAGTVAGSNFLMSTEVLLTRDPKVVEVVERKRVGEELKESVIKIPTTSMFDLSAVWTTPPSFENLKKLCNSANDAARKILEHYQPVDICVEIHKKIVK